MNVLDLLTDPAFLLAVLAWLGVLVGALSMCIAAARGDRIAESNRQDVQTRAVDRESPVLERHLGGWRR